MSGTKSSAIKHGTLTGYQQFHCRCDLCKEARRSYDRNRKEEDRSLAHPPPIVVIGKSEQAKGSSCKPSPRQPRGGE